MKRYEVSKSMTPLIYKIQDNATDHILCTCDSSEDAKCIVDAMNKLYKSTLRKKRTV